MIQQNLELGPIHLWLPGPMKIKLGMSGDQMLEIHSEFGYSSREIEKNVIGKHFQKAQFLISKVEPESALLLDRLYGEVVEQAFGVEVSPRARWIREISGDLSELNFQLKYLAKMASRMGIRILYHAILKHRESLLDLLELLSGSRYGYTYLLPGGARYDLTEGFQERLEIWVDLFIQDYSRIEQLFRWTHPLQNRLKSMGLIIDVGSYGFVSEAAVESTRFGQISHVESRLLFSLQSCKEVAEDLKRNISETIKGDYRVRISDRLENHKVEHRLETIRGVWSLSAEFGERSEVRSIQISSPSDLIKNSIAPALEGESLEDLPLILESLSFTVSEIDR